MLLMFLLQLKSALLTHAVDMVVKSLNYLVATYTDHFVQL